MSVAKRVLLVLACLLAAAGLVLFGYDLFFILTADCDLNDVAGVSDGCIIDWPTGERPLWAMVPAYTYAVALILLASGVLALRRQVGITYSGRTWRGVE